MGKLGKIVQRLAAESAAEFRILVQEVHQVFRIQAGHLTSSQKVGRLSAVLDRLSAAKMDLTVVSSEPSLQESPLQVSSGSSGVVPPPPAKAARSSHETSGHAGLRGITAQVGGRETFVNHVGGMGSCKAISVASSVSRD